MFSPDCAKNHRNSAEKLCSSTPASSVTCHQLTHHDFSQVSVDGTDCTTIDDSNSTPKRYAPGILSLPPQDSQEVPVQPITMAPLGVPTRIIFLHCQLSVENLGGKERPSSPHALAGMLPVGLKSDRGNWNFPDELYSPVNLSIPQQQTAL